MTIWLKCSVEAGMLPGEYAIEMDTSEVGRISLFAPEEKVQAEKGLVNVEMLQDNNGGGILVSLPAPAFEISSRNVRVPQSSVVNFE
jgi:hypothetical protein